MLPLEQPDRIQIAFDDHRLVPNAGLLLPVTLAHHLGLGQLVDHHVDLGRAPGQANKSDKLLTLVASALAGGDNLYPFQSEPDAVPVRLIVRRVKPAPGSQLALFATYSYSAFITDRDDDTLDLEADHRRHAEIENAIRDLKYGVGLNHLPSVRFPANAVWLAVQVLDHNLARWTTRIGLGEPVVTTKTLGRRFSSLAGRLTRKAHRLSLHLPQGWPWQNQFSNALAKLRALPLPS